MIKYFEIDNEVLKVSYNEFTGKIRIFLDEKEFTKIDKRAYILKISDERKEAVAIDGNFIKGIRVFYHKKYHQVLEPIPIYSIVLAGAMLSLSIIIGNIVNLSEFNIYYVGGAIGGGISGLFFALILYISRIIHKKWLQILLSIVIMLACFGVCLGVGTLIGNQL